MAGKITNTFDPGSDIEKLMESSKLGEESSFELSVDESKELLNQFDSEFTESSRILDPLFQKWAINKKLLSNQRRDRKAAGDPLMFSIFYTLLANFWDDKLNVEWEATEPGDDEQESNLNLLSVHDYKKMGKAQLDFDWLWQTMFYGRGLVLFMEFDDEKRTPVSELFDRAVTYYDPYAISVNGHWQTGRGACRYIGREIRITRREMEEDSDMYKNVAQVSFSPAEIGSATQLTEDAGNDVSGKATLNEEKNTGKNEQGVFWEWFTWLKIKDKWERVYTVIGNEQSNAPTSTDETGNQKIKRVLVRLHVIEGEGWPIVEKVLYPLAQTFEAISVPDMTEDKQRFRALALNLGMESVEKGLYQQYLIDKNKLDNPAAILNQDNQFIWTNGSPQGVLEPLQKQQIGQEVKFIMDFLDTSAERALATPSTAQGIPAGGEKTATEIDTLAAGAGKRTSLNLRLFGIGDMKWWLQWYELYKKNMTALDKKIIRLAGPLGKEWRELTRENTMSFMSDPDISIESKAVATAKRQVELQNLSGFIAQASADPSFSMRYALRKMGRLSDFSPSEMDLLMPRTPDELDAEDENKSMEENKPAMVLQTDNHMQHLAVHQKVNRTTELMKHIEAHKGAMIIQKSSPALGQLLAEQNMEGPETAGNPLREAGERSEAQDFKTRTKAPNTVSNQGA